MTTDRAAKLVFIGQNLTLGNVDDAQDCQEYSHIAAHATTTQPQPSTSKDLTASSCMLPTFQLESDHSETEDSEGSIDDPSSPGHCVMNVSLSDIE